ncbi:MAG TPA: dihydroorotase [Alphaproteobacteria bacterium]|jgi:dihydroorotase
MTSDRITIRRPDDWHLHLRDGAMLASVLPHSVGQFARAIVMPNLAPPITTPEMAVAYRARIKALLPRSANFTPLMTCYLTDVADPQSIARGHRDGVFTAAKLYPANATTNSAHGVSDIGRIDAVLEKMSEIGMPLLVHGEVTDPAVDIFDREAVFIERVLIPTLQRHPGLKVVMEHITTQEAADFVLSAGANVAATVTPHHLVINRNSLFQGGLRPHAYCLPVAKRERHRLALRKAATSGSGKLFIGTDSAPHARAAKESGCGCAGIFCAPTALEVYVQVFAEEGALDRFEAFASLNGAAFYGLPPNEGTVTLLRESWTVPESLPAGDTTVVPFMAGVKLPWKLAGSA